jgi:malate synthase
VGRNVASNSSRAPAFEYTILIDGTTTMRVVSDQVGKRIGDCVAVEQGQFVNLRLVDDSRCVPQAGAVPAKKPAPANIKQATACEQAKEQVLAAGTDDEFTVAERRMRLLCGE